MKHKSPLNLILIFTCITAFMSSCGPSAAEQAARQNFVADSIATSAKEELLREQRRAAALDSLNNNLIELKAELAGAKQKLNSLSEFHLMRTEDEKAGQIASQTRIVLELEQAINTTTEKLNNLQ